MESSLETNFDLEFDDVATASLSDAGKWARIIAIIGLVGIILALLFLTLFSSLFGVAMSNFMGSELGAGMAAMTGIIIGIVFIVAIIAGVFLYLLLRFGNKVQQGLISGNPVLVEQGTGALKNYFVLMGILSILGIIISIISIFIVLVGR
jgi:hypothetical protein